MINSQAIIRLDHSKQVVHSCDAQVTKILLESIQSAISDLLDVAENMEDPGEVLDVVKQLMATVFEVAKHG